jgi:hypothetical protein
MIKEIVFLTKNTYHTTDKCDLRSLGTKSMLFYIVDVDIFLVHVVKIYKL